MSVFHLSYWIIIYFTNSGKVSKIYLVIDWLEVLKPFENKILIFMVCLFYDERGFE